MHPLQGAITGFLSAAATGEAPLNEAALDEMLAKVKESVMKQFHTKPEENFRLRMSNIGRDTRQLMLEKKYGREPASPSFILKMLQGSLQEHLFVYMLRSAGVEFDVGGKCSLEIAGEKIDGEWDLRLHADGKIYDVKTASEYSYSSKFASFSSLNADDSFGYIDQLLGYAEAQGAEPGGWLVINKVTGDYKVVEYPYTMAQARDTFRSRLSKKIAVVNGDRMPACNGVIAENWYGKPTGNLVLGPNCRFCSHKDKCHKEVTYEPQRNSKAQNPKYLHYVKD